ncbi:zinc ribbon domain-containing protein [Ruminococcus sp.]|uniref:zinc ribbon domain-containing protein n=1 Tax=Ruminococcus sp. TaxID=41978 RepID=UPI002E8214A4|nr:zinc ribbon domain-containing protein [Ruminococcus sp.]MEE3439385.1 zinc ribbon domain-containing protein [Ruminococcus sp.]
MFCKKCGNKLEEGSLFCDQCGEPVSKRALQNEQATKNKVEVIDKSEQVPRNDPAYLYKEELESKSHSNKGIIMLILVIVIIIVATVLLIINILNPKTDDDANSATTTTTQVETTTELETTEPETTEPEESYDELYYDCLNNIYNKYGQETRYSFYDFNKDGIDELIVSYGESELGWFNEVYAINDGKIYSAGTFPKPSAFYIDENDEGIYAIWTKQGCGLIQHITMEEGSNQITVEDTGSQDFSSYEANEPLENDYAETYLDNY